MEQFRIEQTSRDTKLWNYAHNARSYMQVLDVDNQ
jgi:hypothetical protein